MQATPNSPALSISGRLEKHNKHNSDDDDDPEVRVASWLFLLVGIGYLFPISALTQPVDYWNLLFPDFNMEFPLTTLYLWTNLIVLGILVGFTNQQQNQGPLSFTPRIIGGFIGQLVVLLFVPTSYFWHLSEDWNRICILGATAAAAIVTAFLDSCVIALSAQYPLRVRESLQIGVGLSTLIGSLYRDATKLLIPSLVESSLLYFYAGAVTIACCIVAYVQLMRLNLTQRCLAHTNSVPVLTQDILDATERSTLLNHPTAQESPVIVDKWSVWRRIWFNELMVGLLFTSTLALWPPLVTEIRSYNFPRLDESGWWSLVLLTVFSVSDCVGRVLVRYRGPLTRHNIWIAVVARLGLVPLIVCSVKGVAFTHDGFSIVFVMILGWTNGYVGSLCIVMVNECIEAHEQAVVGSITSFALNTGLVVGATIGMIMGKLVVGHGE